jgi:hypothetical protein
MYAGASYAQMGYGLLLSGSLLPAATIVAAFAAAINLSANAEPVLLAAGSDAVDNVNTYVAVDAIYF